MIIEWMTPYTIKEEKKRVFFKWFMRHHILYEDTPIYHIDADEGLAKQVCAKMNSAYNVGWHDAMKQVEIDKEKQL